MLKLERSSDRERTTIRLIGRARSEHLDEITKQMGSCRPEVTLDLEEVTVVDVDVVRFLGTRVRGKELNSSIAHAICGNGFRGNSGDPNLFPSMRGKQTHD